MWSTPGRNCPGKLQDLLEIFKELTVNGPEQCNLDLEVALILAEVWTRDLQRSLST